MSEPLTVGNITFNLPAEFVARQLRIEQMVESINNARTPDVMTIKELGEYWRVTRSSINKWIREKNLPNLLM